MNRLPRIQRTLAHPLLAALVASVAVLIGLQASALAKHTGQAWRDGHHRYTAPGARIPSWPFWPSADADRDGLTNWTEIVRTRTNWRNADTDGDGLDDGKEIELTRTDPRRADSDGDGADDGAEILAGSDPWNPASVPAGTTPPADTTPPETSIESGPPSPTTATGASFAFSASEDGSSLACQLDSGPWGTCTSPAIYSALGLGSHTFSVRATDSAGNVDTSPATWTWTVVAPEPPAPEPPVEEPPPGPPQAPSSCAAGATNAASAAAVSSAVAARKSVCVTAAIGNLGFSGLGDRSGVVISTDGGSIGHLEIGGTAGLTLRSARLRSVTIRSSNRTVIESSTIGGTAANRVSDQLIFMPDQSNDVIIRNNDIGWTEADDSGNTGYGCRCYGRTDRLQFVGNVVHDIAADGFQGTNGTDVLIDRNKIGPVGANPGSSEHSDNIQIVGNGPNLRITNNWIFEQGYYDGGATGNAGSTYIHGGTSNSVLYENNLIQIARGRTEICGLGTGGTSRSNITIRRNTWVEGGQTFANFPGFEWDCDSGSGNTVERNLAIDPDGGFAQNGSSGAATFSSNLWGKPSLVTLDPQGNCTSANCNPAGQEPIGYRKPTGVRW